MSNSEASLMLSSINRINGLIRRRRPHKSRAMTLGVRGMVFNKSQEVFLVKHSYYPGWHLPGGGVEARETVIDALKRELVEECNITLTSKPKLFGSYFNEAASIRDHVILFVVEDFEQGPVPAPNNEIVAHGFFAITALPADTGPATRRRINEVQGNDLQADRW